MMIKANQTDKTQVSDGFKLPPDPFDRWNPPVAIIDTRKPIYFQREQLFSSEGKGLWGRINARFFNWLTKNAD